MILFFIFYFFSANLAMKYAEDNKLGQIVNGEFIPSKISQDFIKLILLPTASVKEMIGNVPYVR